VVILKKKASSRMPIAEAGLGGRLQGGGRRIGTAWLVKAVHSLERGGHRLYKPREETLLIKIAPGGGEGEKIQQEKKGSS